MTALELVAMAGARGVRLEVNAAGSLDMIGAAAARAELRPMLVAAKAELVTLLRGRAPSDGETFSREGARLRVAERVPRLQVGDVWHDVPTEGAMVEITTLLPQEDMPWPMVTYRRLDGAQDLDPRIGAPAFIFGRKATP